MMPLESQENSEKQPEGAATGLDARVPVWKEFLVLTVALRKKLACNPQNMETIIPDRERAEPSPESRPLRSHLAGFDASGGTVP
jgi:hypothetical protein